MENTAFKPVWSENFQVRSFDIGLNSLMRVSSVCSYFQEIAGRHATHLGVGYKYMQQNNKVWVLSRLYLKINKLPSWGQEFKAKTWPSSIERVFFRREYSFDDGEDNLISASSYWILLDINTRKPVTANIDEQVMKLNKDKYALTIPSQCFSNVYSPITDIHNVKYSDLDHNRHVNNARYVEWIFDMVDQEILEKWSPSFFAIEYKHEVRSGDTVSLCKNKPEVSDEIIYTLEGKIVETNQVCFRSKIIF